MGVVMMKKVIAILVVCSICGVLSQDELVAEQIPEAQVTNAGCLWVANNFKVCADEKYAANQADCEKHAQQYWTQFGCSRFTAQVKDVKSAMLMDETVFENAEDLVETETSAVEDTNHDEVLLDVQTKVASLKKKGASEAECKDLAKTSCKEVEDEVTKSQEIVDKLKTGKSCVGIGKAAILKAKIRVGLLKKMYYKAKKNVKMTLEARVSFSKQRFNTLTRGKCGFIFGSRSYLSAKLKYQRAMKTVTIYLARLKEASQIVVNLVLQSFHQMKKCFCKVKKIRNSTWKVVSSPRTRARQVKAHAKCKMMQCVLNGIPSKSSKCKASLPKLKNKKIVKEAEVLKC